MEPLSYIAGLVGLMAFVPQTFRTIKMRETRDLSLITYVMLCLTSVLWTIYGFGKHEPAIWITNIIVGTCSVIITVLKLRYG